jgi:hypothetical protein
LTHHGLGKFSDIDMPVSGNLGSDIGNESQIPNLPFAVEESLVGSQFLLLTFF